SDALAVAGASPRRPASEGGRSDTSPPRPLPPGAEPLPAANAAASRWPSGREPEALPASVRDPRPLSADDDPPRPASEPGAWLLPAVDADTSRSASERAPGPLSAAAPGR